MNPAWYALRVRSNFEQTTTAFLQSESYRVFCPTYRERRHWSDRTKEINVPMFGGYIFCHMDIQKRLPVIQAPGVVNMVSFGKTFLPVPDDEIEAVRTIVNSPLFARPCPYLNVGDWVRVERGPLAGVEGILQEIKKECRLVVSVHLLQRSVSVEVSLDWIKPVKQSFRIPESRAHTAPAGDVGSFAQKGVRYVPVRASLLYLK